MLQADNIGNGEGMNPDTHSISATAALAALQRNRVDHVVTVPDWVQLALHDQLNRGTGTIRVVPCSNENQVVTVVAGLTLGGKRPLAMMQNQGLYNCFNTLRAISLDARIPMVYLVGQFGREFDNFGRPARDSRRIMVRLAEPFLQSIGVPFHCLDDEDDLTCMDQAFAQAEAERTAVALLISAPMAWR
jgi:sulfopyruvate decarboxylase TPP-binding subunit